MVTENSNGQTIYVDMQNIMEQKGNVFFWELIDYNHRDEYGDLSAKIFIEGDCKKNRFKWLKLSYHKHAMAKDIVQDQKPSKLFTNWQNANLNSTSMAVLNFVCSNKGIIL